MFFSGSKCLLTFVTHLALCVGDTLMRTDSQHRRPHVGKMLMNVMVTPFRVFVTPSLNNPVRNVFRLEFSSKFLWPMFCLQTSASSHVQFVPLHKRFPTHCSLICLRVTRVPFLNIVPPHKMITVIA